MEAEPLIHWPEPFVQYVSFVAQFLAAGAVGFRYFVVRDRWAPTQSAFSSSAHPPLFTVYGATARRAAALGLLGIVVTGILVVQGLPRLAAKQHVTLAELAIGDAPTTVRLGLLGLAIIGFLIATGGRSLGWTLAAIGVVAGALNAVFFGQWSRLVNPIHLLAAGLWLGTLFILVVVGMSVVMRHADAREHRDRIVADMVNAFSPFALTMGGVVVAFGAITAWRHLHHLHNLWSTPYGYALIVKLCTVAAVFGLGAWNWRRQRPTLGSEGAAHAIRRTATAELTVAAIVLAVTAILVSLPSPKGP